MPNYSETLVPGETRRRAHYLSINNVEGQSPAVTITTQDRINLANGEREYVTRDQFVALFDEDGLGEVFQLINIENGQPLSQSMTGLQLMVAVQSWVLHQMMKRDAALAPAPEPESGGTP